MANGFFSRELLNISLYVNVDKSLSTSFYQKNSYKYDTIAEIKQFNWSTLWLGKTNASALFQCNVATLSSICSCSNSLTDLIIFFQLLRLEGARGGRHEGVTPVRRLGGVEQRLVVDAGVVEANVDNDF